MAKAWQGGGGSSGKPVGGKDWQKGSARKAPNLPGGPPWWQSRRVRIWAVVLSIFAAAGVWVGVFLWPKPLDVPQLVLIEAGYEGNLAVPHFVAGRNSCAALEEWLKTAVFPGTRRGSKPESQKVQIDGDPLKVLEPLSRMRGSKVPRVVVYVAAHGVARPGDEGPVLYLVPQNHDPAKTTEMFAFDHLLKELGSLPDTTEKLLVLDVSSVHGSWSMGEYAPSFVNVLLSDTYKARIKDVKKLVVLCSADKAEAGWASPDLGKTAFAHYLLEGLRGAADEDRNGGVTTKELGKYVTHNVERWARNNRDRRQNPVMIPDDDSRGFEIVSVGGPPPRADDPAAPADDDDVAREVGTVGELWKECARLEASRPWERRPHLWRRYVESLVRAEELARNPGSPDHASRVRNSCSEMARQLGRLPAGPGDSRRLTVPMEEAFGGPLNKEEQQSLRPFTVALDRSDYELATKQTKGLEGRVRMEAIGALLKHAGTVKKPAKWSGELSKQPGWLGVLGALDSGSPARPAEAHYLAMALHESAPAMPDAPELWRTTVEVRLLAERAVLAGGPPVSPWLRKILADADGLRRPAQDLLFTTQPGRWQESGRNLETAREGYERAVKVAGEVARVLRVRDEAFVRLPYLTRLVGELSSQDAEADRLELSWKHLWELNATLAGWEPNVEKLKAMGTLVEGDLADAQRFADRRAEELSIKERQLAQTPWHQIEGFLRLPVANPALRAALVARSRDISHALLLGAQNANPNAMGAGTVRAGAVRQAKLAVATTFSDEKMRAVVREHINAKDDLTGIGETVVKERVKAGATARDLTAKAAKSAPADAEKTLAQAAAAFRTLDGWVGDDHHGRVQPAEDLYNLLTHVLLCRQAERAFHEHWVAEDAKPYYKEAGGLFLRDATRIYEGADLKSPRMALAADVGKLLESARPLALEWALTSKGEPWLAGDSEFHLTDEPLLRRYYRLSGPDNVKGHSVRRMSATKGLMAPSQDTEPWALDAVHPEAIRPEKGLYERPKQKATHTVVAYFRGQRGQAATNVQIEREPDNLTIAPPRPAFGRLAIVSENQAFERYAASKYAIAFVLDCSKSMLEGKTSDGRNRWEAAKETLGRALATLPRGVTVSLRAFGVKGDFAYDNPKAPTKIIKYDETRVVWKAHPWDPAKLDARMKDIHALQPDGYTPLMRAIKYAHDRDLNAPGMAGRFEDRRTLVVITDGGDFTWYAEEFDKATPGAKAYQERDKEIKKGPGDTITMFMERTFKVPPAPKGKGVKLAVIDFGGDFTTKWEEKAYKETKKAVPAVGGTYDRAVNAAELFKLLTSRMLDLRYFVDADINRPGFALPELSGRISRYDPRSKARENLEWLPIKPDNYRAWVPLLPGGIKQRITIHHGDALVLEMTGKGDTPYYRRWMYINRLVDTAAFAKRVPGEARWVMGAVENWQAGAGGHLRTMTTLEKDDDTANPGRHVQVVHPTFSWIELYATESRKLARPVRTTALPNYPAPAWGTIAPDWELAEKVTKKAWWAEAAFLPPASHLVLKDEEAITSLRERKLVMKDVGDEVTVESVTVEDGLRVPMEQDGGTSTVIDQCLVVRLRYKPGTGPFLVKVGDVEWPGGQAHRFFYDGGKYTGIFWPVNKAKLETLRELSVYSVAELKKVSVSQSREIDLGTPRNGNVRPEPLQ